MWSIKGKEAGVGMWYKCKMTEVSSPFKWKYPIYSLAFPFTHDVYVYSKYKFAVVFYMFNLFGFGAVIFPYHARNHRNTPYCVRVVKCNCVFLNWDLISCAFFSDIFKLQLYPLKRADMWNLARPCLGFLVLFQGMMWTKCFFGSVSRYDVIKMFFWFCFKVWCDQNHYRD